MNTTASAIAPIGPYFCHNAWQKQRGRSGGRKAGVEKRNNNVLRKRVHLTMQQPQARKLAKGGSGNRRSGKEHEERPRTIEARKLDYLSDLRSTCKQAQHPFWVNKTAVQPIHKTNPTNNPRGYPNSRGSTAVAKPLVSRNSTKSRAARREVRVTKATFPIQNKKRARFLERERSASRRRHRSDATVHPVR